MIRAARVTAALIALGAASCGSPDNAPEDAAVAFDAAADMASPLDLSIDASNLDGEVPSAYPNDLAAWGLFEGNGSSQEPVSGVVPYAVISPLFSDQAAKHRFLRIPAGTHIGYSAEGPWDFPVGTVLVKTFSYVRDAREPSLGERLMETRLLVHEEDAWVPLTYVWNDAQTAATRTSIGARIPATWVDVEGETHTLDYRVPNTNQCKSCHGGDEPAHPLGPRTRQLDRTFDYESGAENQIDHLASLGWLENAPTAGDERPRLVDPLDDSSSLDDRARAYLDANCSHCHREHGAAHSSGLWLESTQTDPVRLGICKRPPAAGGGSCGLTFDIVPGHPELSILACRVASSDPAVKMPELPQQLVHAEGLDLLREWITSLPAASCTP